VADTPNTFGMRDASSRVERFCEGCGNVDADPHHVAANADGTTRSMHMDCCAHVGCPDGTCDRVLAEAGDKRHAALVEHLTNNTQEG
jgi:hypothetical protein